MAISHAGMYKQQKTQANTLLKAHFLSLNRHNCMNQKHELCEIGIMAEESENIVCRRKEGVIERGRNSEREGVRESEGVKGKERERVRRRRVRDKGERGERERG